MDRDNGAFKETRVQRTTKKTKNCLADCALSDRGAAHATKIAQDHCFKQVQICFGRETDAFSQDFVRSVSSDQNEAAGSVALHSKMDLRNVLIGRRTFDEELEDVSAS